MLNPLPNWTRKDLLSMEGMSRAEIETIHQLARSFKASITDGGGKVPYLQGKTLINLFLEPSTRTRVAFELAAKRLGADCTTITESASSLLKGETLRDTAQVIQALQADMIVIRHSAAGAAHYLADRLQIPVINAGDGCHEHPTQALLDSFTMLEHFGSLEGRKITILGDILFSRVARSNIWTLQQLGAKVTVAGPRTLVPEAFTELGVDVCHDLRLSLEDADVVMLLRIQKERQMSSHFPGLGEYRSMFGLTRDRASWLKPGALIMHPGPINRGVEIDSPLADSPQSVILQQVTNGVVNRMAVLCLCCKAMNPQLA